MRKVGFSEQWMIVVQNCLESASFSFIVNQSPHGFESPTRDIHQGCPLFPYLLLLCAKGFLAIIQSAINHQSLHSFMCSRSGLVVSHLLFLDDSLVFFKTSIQECSVIKKILLSYELSCSQRINFQKLAITYSPNVGDKMHKYVLDCLGLEANYSHEKYLAFLYY